MSFLYTLNDKLAKYTLLLGAGFVASHVYGVATGMLSLVWPL